MRDGNIKFKITVGGWGSEQPELVEDAHCKGSFILKSPFQPKLSCDSTTDFDRVGFYWEKKKLRRSLKEGKVRLWAKLIGSFKDRH